MTIDRATLELHSAKAIMKERSALSAIYVQKPASARLERSVDRHLPKKDKHLFKGGHIPRDRQRNEMIRATERAERCKIRDGAGGQVNLLTCSLLYTPKIGLHQKKGGRQGLGGYGHVFRVDEFSVISL